MQSLEVKLYFRPDCCRCESAAQLLESLHGDYHFTLEKIDITARGDLPASYCCQVPVITINGGNRLALRMTEERLRRGFERALRRQT